MPDVATGDKRRFGIEVVDHGLQSSTQSERSAVSLGGAEYDIRAHVLLADPDFTALDLGLLALSASELSARAGDWLAGPAALVVDLGAYLELGGPGKKSWFHEYWSTITGIWMMTAPLIETGPAHFRIRIRDPEKMGWAPIDRTDAWADDDGNAYYVVRCRLDDDPTMRLT